MHALVHTDVGKDRLDNAQPSGVDLLSLIGIDLGLHLIDQVGRLRIHWDGKIPARSRWLAQTACPHRAGSAVLRAGMVDIISSVAVDQVAGMACEFMSLRAEINLLAWIEREVRSGEES